MTSLAEGTQPAARGRVLWPALAVSLALNLCFLGAMGWLWIRGEHMLTPAQRVQQIGEDLGLSGEQHDSFQQFIAQVRHDTRQLRENNEPLLKRVWEELGKPQPDQAVIGRLVDQATVNRRAYQTQMAVVLSNFLGTLSPDQRAEFIALAQKHKDPVAERLRRLVTP